MSIHYDIFEHLIIKKKTEEDYELNHLKYLLQDRISLLAMKAITDKAKIYKLSITYDGKEQEFSGQMISNELQTMIREMVNADEIEIIVEYSVIWGHWSSEVNLDIFRISSFLEESDKSLFDSVRYVLYHQPDCNPIDAGELSLFGYKDNTLVRGKLELERVNQIPEDMPWYGVQTVVYHEGVELGPEEVKIVSASCKDLMKLSHYDQYFEYPDGIDYWMDNAELKSSDDFEKLIENINILRKYIGEYLCLSLYFINSSNDKPKILYLDLKEDGSCDYYLAQA